MGLGFLSANRAFYQPETKVLMVTICSLNKKAGGSSKYDETQALASKLVRTRDDLLKARREAFDLLFSGQIKWQGIPLGNLKYNKELRLGKDFGENIEDVKYLPAIYRYDGRFYTALGRDGRDKLLRSKHHVLIMSGLYGLVTTAEPIQLYSMPIERGSKVQEIWKRNKVLTRVLVEYAQLNRIKRIFDFTARSDYRELIDWDFVANATGAEVFRRFRLPEGVGIKVLKVHDMVDLKPFEAAANMTSMIILKKGVNTKYPVPYIRWTKTKECDLTNATLEEVFHICSQDELIAVPIDTKDNTFQWLTVNKKVLSALDKIRGSSHYEPHLGVNTGGANGVYWIKIVDKHPSGNLLIENLYDIGKRKLEKIAALIEPKHIFKLIRSGDLNRWLPTPTNYIIVPHTEQTDWQAIPEHKLRVESPKTYEYLLHFKEMLLKRSAYTLLRKGHPFYIMVDIRKNSFAPYKVAWKRMGDKINASVLSPMEDKYIGKKPLIPQETISFIPLKQEDEAHYLCSILNSSEVTFLVKSFSQLGGKSFATPSILGQINILKYDPENPIHRKLAELSKKAHQLASEKNTYELSKIEEDIDNTVAELYGLTDEEAKEIKNALKTLEGEEIEKEIVEEESIEVKVDFLSAVASPNVAGSFEVAISNPLKDTVRIELQLPDRKVELETDKEQETVKVQVPPLEAREYKIPYKIITRSKVARGEFTLHVKEKKRFRKDETLTSKLDELLGDKG